MFKNHTMKTSILDDFMYYENRQKMMQEERARLLVGSFQNPFSVPALEPPHKLLNVADQLLLQEEIGDPKDSNSVRMNTMTVSEAVHTNSNEEGKDDMASVLKIGSLTINPKNEHEMTRVGSFVDISKVDTEQSEVLTVGSMPVKVNGLNDTSSSLSVGTILLDPQPLQAEAEEAAARGDAAKPTTGMG